MPKTHIAKRCPDGTIKVTSPTGTSILEQQAVAAAMLARPNPFGESAHPVRDVARMLKRLANRMLVTLPTTRRKP